MAQTARRPRATPTPSEAEQMIISNTQEIPGKTIVDFFGVVSGSTVRAKHIGRDIMASL